MTVGFLMVFCGFHFRVVESFVLTPQATRFINEQQDGLELTGDLYSDSSLGAVNRDGSFLPNYRQASQAGNRPLSNASFSRMTAEPTEEKKVITPPNWMGWPMIYVGAVLILFGLTTPRSN